MIMLFPSSFAFDKDDRFKGVIEMKFAKPEDKRRMSFKGTWM